jgi:hypothetical protein
MFSLLPVHAREARERLKNSSLIATQADLAAAEARIELLVVASTGAILTAIDALKSESPGDAQLVRLNKELKEASAALQKAVDANS